ncbi:MAG: sulfatase-like hydrolase/transferase [Myxococcota bacterium]|nr:sulfatase-like hydrolase/transferase [Myxococcota bacterium]
MSEDKHFQTEVRPVAPGRSLAEERSTRSRLFLAARIPPLGALMGGASVGFLEALYINFQSYGTYDWSGLVYAVLLYGAVGLLCGLGLSVGAVVLTLLLVQAPDPARSWSVSYLVVACSMSLVIGRFILRRDLYGESELPLMAGVGLLSVVILCACIFYLFVKNALSKTFFSFMTQTLGTGTVYAGFLLLTLSIGAGNCMSNRAGAQVAPRPVASELGDRPNLLLVVVDTLRADALGSYGAPGDVTPNADALAARSLLFEQAYAQAPWTRPSFASLLSSTVPTTHQTSRKADQLPDELVTVAERLRDHGYTTGAIVNNINIASSYNFHQGFDTFEFLRPAYLFRASQASFRLTVYQQLRRFWETWVSDEKRVERYYRDAREITDAATDWLTVHGNDRWFLMVQYMDPHDPYFPPPYDGTGYARVEHPRPESWEAAALKELYMGEVAYWDAHFGRLLQYLRARGLDESTVIVVTSDHGEEFGEHGGFGHGTQLYDESIRVPLLVSLPVQNDLKRPPRHEPGRMLDPVRLIDVAPTLTDLAGAESGPRWQGRSLLREYALRSQEERLVLSEVDFEGVGAASVRTRDWKLIRNDRRQGGVPSASEELYYLRDDPGEELDLSADSSAAWSLERRRAELTMLEQRARGEAVDRRIRDLVPSPEECEMLRSLGYTALATDVCAPP